MGREKSHTHGVASQRNVTSLVAIARVKKTDQAEATSNDQL
jgi:hypothetical protein